MGYHACLRSFLFLGLVWVGLFVLCFVCFLTYFLLCSCVLIVFVWSFAFALIFLLFLCFQALSAHGREATRSLRWWCPSSCVCSHVCPLGISLLPFPLILCCCVYVRARVTGWCLCISPPLSPGILPPAGKPQP